MLIFQPTYILKPTTVFTGSPQMGLSQSEKEPRGALQCNKSGFHRHTSINHFKQSIKSQEREQCIVDMRNALPVHFIVKSLRKMNASGNSQCRGVDDW